MFPNTHVGTAISVGDGASAEALSKAGTRRVVSRMLKLKRKRISPSHCLGQSIEESNFEDSVFFQLFCRSWDSHIIVFEDFDGMIGAIASA